MANCVVLVSECTYGQLCPYIQASSDDIHTANTLQPDRWQYDLPAVCYHPAVFFRLLRLIALSLPKEKIQRVFKNAINPFVIFFKLFESETAYNGTQKVYKHPVYEDPLS
jgi:hypothetical protein